MADGSPNKSPALIGWGHPRRKVLFDVIVGRTLDLTGAGDNFEIVDEDGPWDDVHVELVREQADIDLLHLCMLYYLTCMRPG